MGAEEKEFGLSADLVREHSDEIAAGCAGSLTTVLGSDFSASMKSVDVADETCAIQSDGPVVHALCRGESDGVGYALHVVTPREEAAVLAGLQLGEDAAEIEEATKSELSGERRAAFQGVAKALLGSVATAMGDAFETEVTVQDAREIADPVDDPTWLDAGNFVRLRLAIECDLIEDGVLFILLPGDGTAPESAAGSVIFLERCPDEYERLESLGNDLTCNLSVEQPDLFLAELGDEVFQGIIVVPWDLGGRSGLELVETLRIEPRLAGARIAMSSDAPTRGQVGAAMRAGAMTFLSRPYLKQEIEARLLGVEADAPSAGPAGASEEIEKDPAPASGDSDSESGAAEASSNTD